MEPETKTENEQIKENMRRGRKKGYRKPTRRTKLEPPYDVTVQCPKCNVLITIQKILVLDTLDLRSDQKFECVCEYSGKFPIIKIEKI
jgi:hypothetical protein